MSIRNPLLSLIVVVAVGAMCLATPSETRAQNPNPGQMVEAIARSNAAQLALVKKAASDPAFAAAMKSAMASGNYDAAASLVSTATGVAKSSVQVSVNGSAPAAGGGDAAASGERTGLFHLASLETKPSATATFYWNFCLTFSFGSFMNATRSVVGCVATWPWG
jgi:hypothetical protein